MSYIEDSNESDIILITTDDNQRSKFKKRVKERRRNVLMCTERDRELIQCEILRHQRRKVVSVSDRRHRLNELMKNMCAPRQRIVPCCKRTRCSRSDYITEPDRHTRKKQRKSKRRSSEFKSKSSYLKVNTTLHESISSDSLLSEVALDQLIRSTRQRMNKLLFEQSTPIIHTSTYEDLDSTFELNSIHSLDTVVIEKSNDVFVPMSNSLTDCDLSPIGYISTKNIKIENNNIEYYSPSMAIEDLDIDVKPTIFDSNYDCNSSPLSDEYYEHLYFKQEL